MTSEQSPSARSRWIPGAVFAVGATAGLVLVRRLRRSASGADADSDRWLAVTIDRRPEEVMPGGRLPDPLAELGDLVEVAVAIAPGDKGTELRARPRPPEGAASVGEVLAGDDPRRRVRVALRRAKQLIETGEVLLVDPVPHGRRPRTPQGKLVDLAAARADKEGVL